jgi:CheY-like chemotaxis protein
MSDMYRVLVISPDDTERAMIDSVLRSGGHLVQSHTEVTDQLLKQEDTFQFFILDQSISQDLLDPVLVKARNQGRVALIRIGESEEPDPGPTPIQAVLNRPIDPVDLSEVFQGVGKWFNKFETLPDTPRILIVDDNEYVLESSLAILEDDYSVNGTLSALEGLDLLMKSPFELLLVDLMMEEMHGMDLIHRAKREMPNLIAIVMTGYSSKEAAIRAVREGANDYLEKPLTPEAVRESVTKAWAMVKPQLEKNVMIRKVLSTNQQILTGKSTPSDSQEKQDTQATDGGEMKFSSQEEKESMLLDQLLSSMNVEMDEDTLQIEAISLTNLVEEVRAELAATSSVPEPGFSVSEMPEIQSDLFILRKSLYLLLKDSYESCSKKSGGQVRITCEESGPGQILLQIQDSGFREPGSTTHTFKVLVGEEPRVESGEPGFDWLELRRNLQSVGASVQSYQCNAEGLVLKLKIPLKCAGF